MSLIPSGGNKLAPNPWFVERMPETYLNMGLTAERLQQKFGVSREDSDRFGGHESAHNSLILIRDQPKKIDRRYFVAKSLTTS